MVKNGRKSANFGPNPFQLCSYHGYVRYHIWYPERWIVDNHTLEVHTYSTRDKNERNIQIFCRKLKKLVIFGLNPLQLCSCHGHCWYHIWYSDQWFDDNDIFEVDICDTRDKNEQNMPTVCQKSWKLLMFGCYAYFCHVCCRYGPRVYHYHQITYQSIICDT